MGWRYLCGGEGWDGMGRDGLGYDGYYATTTTTATASSK